MSLINVITHKSEEGVFQFFNFVEYPGGEDKKHGPTLYFSLGLKLNAAVFAGIPSCFGFILNDVRLVDGKFQNPYRGTGSGFRAQAYLNSCAAQLIESIWLEAVQPKLPRWKLVEGAWAGLAFDPERISKAMLAPYNVFSKEKSKAARRKRAIERMEIE